MNVQWPEPEHRGSWMRALLWQHALPLWWRKGADHLRGGYHEALSFDLRPQGSVKRLRLQARQVFVYAQAGRLGWDGPWREAMLHGLGFLLERYFRADGLMRTAVDGDSADEVDLYDQAFALLAFASAYRSTASDFWKIRAEALLDAMDEHLGHPIAGYFEASPEPLPLRSNPHMHLLEALLAWVEAGGGGAFARRARAIRDLALDRLVDPATGIIGERYDRDWLALNEGRGDCMPGHQYEWAFLLHRANELLGEADCRQVLTGLVGFAERHGVLDGRVVMCVDRTGRLCDSDARFWSQLERLRTSIACPDAFPSGAAAAARESFAAVRAYCAGVPDGMWRDRVDAAGAWVEQPCPGSTLYHLVSAFSELETPLHDFAQEPCRDPRAGEIHLAAR